MHSSSASNRHTVWVMWINALGQSCLCLPCRDGRHIVFSAQRSRLYVVRGHSRGQGYMSLEVTQGHYGLKREEAYPNTLFRICFHLHMESPKSPQGRNMAYQCPVSSVQSKTPEQAAAPTYFLTSWRNEFHKANRQSSHVSPSQFTPLTSLCAPVTNV